MANKLVCTVELDKEKGVTITVKNESGKITQTMHLDGTKITTEVKGAQHSSVITQTDNGVVTKIVKGSKALSTVTQKLADITVDCENYSLNAEKISFKSKKETSVDSKDKVIVKSQKDTLINSKSKVSVSAMSDISLDTKGKFSASATKDASMKGMNVKLDGKMNTQIKAGTAASMQGLKVDITGKAQANLAAAVTSVGKDLTTIKGKMTKVEGMLVKLG